MEKPIKRVPSRLAAAGAALALAIVPLTAAGAPFADNFDTAASATNWTVNQTPDTEVTFGYNYAADDIPAAPRSGGNRTGLKLRANINSTASTDGITMTPTGVTNTGAYRITFDAWMNTVGPFPAGGTGSTYQLGAGVGYDGTTINRVTTNGSGAWFAQSGDTGFSGTSTTVRDYMAFRNNGTMLENSTAPGVYFATDSTATDAQDHINPYYAFLTSKTPPGGQTTADPAAQTGSTAAGTPTFQWVQWDIIVGDGKATWYLNGTPIAVLDSAVAAVPLDGLASLTYYDPNTTAPAKPAFTFGIVDNFQILVPEPATASLLGLLAVSVLGRRRRSSRI